MELRVRDGEAGPVLGRLRGALPRGLVGAGGGLRGRAWLEAGGGGGPARLCGLSVRALAGAPASPEPSEGSPAPTQIWDPEAGEGRLVLALPGGATQTQGAEASGRRPGSPSGSSGWRLSSLPGTGGASLGDGAGLDTPAGGAGRASSGAPLSLSLPQTAPASQAAKALSPPSQPALETRDVPLEGGSGRLEGEVPEAAAPSSSALLLSQARPAGPSPQSGRREREGLGMGLGGFQTNALVGILYSPSPAETGAGAGAGGDGAGPRPPASPAVAPAADEDGELAGLLRSPAAGGLHGPDGGVEPERPAGTARLPSSGAVESPVSGKRARESAPLGEADRNAPAGLAGGSRSLRKRRPGGAVEPHEVRVLFSHSVRSSARARQEKIVRKLGGQVVGGDRGPLDGFTHFVVPAPGKEGSNFRRSRDALVALARGLPIVSENWLLSCEAAHTFLDGADFLLQDPSAERKFRFAMGESLRRARESGVLRGRRVYVTPGVDAAVLRLFAEVVPLAGGSLVSGRVTQFTKPGAPQGALDGLLVVSCPEDAAFCAPLSRRGVPLYSPGLVLDGLVRQRLDLQGARLKLG